MPDTINIGIIGCARITNAHLRGYKILRDHGINNFRITALCARKLEDALMFRKRGEGPPPRPPVMPPETGDPLAAPHMYVSDLHDDVEVEVYTDYNEMIKKAKIDVVDIYASLFIHHLAAIPALEAKKHAMVEKPFAISVKAGQRMVEAAEKNHRLLAVAENAHYSLGTRSAGWTVRGGYIGDLQMYVSGGIGGFWSPNKIVAQTPWRHKKLLGGGGGTIDLGVHLFNMIRYICGEVDEVSATVKTFEKIRYTKDNSGKVIDQTESEVEDAFFAWMKFKNGAIGQILSSWAGHGEGVGIFRSIYGSKGCLKGGDIILDDGTKTSIEKFFNDRVEAATKEKFFPMGIADTFALEKLDFLRAIETGSEPETSGKEGVKDLAASFAILESAALNRPVKVAEVEACRIEAYQKEINNHYKL